ETPPSQWPKEWSTTYYKEYLRFPTIELPKPELGGGLTLQTAIENRRSYRDFSGGALDLQQLSGLLKYSCGEFRKNTDDSAGGYRAQASGGARFPIEMYLLLFSSNEAD